MAEEARLRRYTERTIWRKNKWEFRAAVVIIVGLVLYFFFWPAPEPGSVASNVDSEAAAPPDTLRRSITDKLAKGDVELTRVVRERTIGLSGLIELDFLVLPDSLAFQIPNQHKVDVTFTRLSGESEILDQSVDDSSEEFQKVTWIGDITEGDTLRVSLHPKEHMDLSHDISNYNLDWILVLVR